MKRTLKIIFAIAIIIIFIVAFSGSYLSFSIDNLAFVIAIGVDVGSNNNLKVSFQFIPVSSVNDTGNTDETPAFINSVETYSIEEAINIMNAYLGKQLNLSHCKVIVFSEEVAINGIRKEIYSLINNTQIRPTTNIIISKCDAYSYIDNSNPSIENLISKYYEIFPNSSQYTGYTINATIANFFNSLICNTCEPFAILGGISSEDTSSVTNAPDEVGTIKSNNTGIVGKRNAENIGIAVFNEDMLVR